MRFLRPIIVSAVLLLAGAPVLAAAPAPGGAPAAPAPHAIDIPAWFADTFLDLREDVREAARENRRVLLYFGQDGCPYCRELLQTNFTQPAIVEKTRRHFTAIALNIWGDREVTGIDGKVMSEKDFARALRVQFTPTLLVLDEKGAVIARINGYYPPHRLSAALDWAADRSANKPAFAEHMRTAVKEAASERLHEQPFLRKTTALSRKRGEKPLVVLFETRFCAGCDELHREGFARPEVRALLDKFDVVRVALGDSAQLVAPDGRRIAADAWVRELRIAYTPSMVFFDESGREVFRIEAYQRPFHLASSLDYVSSGAFRAEPNYQRFLQARVERMRERGERVEMWK